MAGRSEPKSTGGAAHGRKLGAPVQVGRRSSWARSCSRHRPRFPRPPVAPPRCQGEQWQSVGGRGFRLDPTSPLARSEWLAVAEVAGAASGARILSAAAIELSDVEAMFAERDRDLHGCPLRSDDRRDQRDQGPQARRDPPVVRARSPAQPGRNRGRTDRSCRPPRPRHSTVERELPSHCDNVPPSPPCTIESIPDLSDSALLARARRMAGATSPRQAPPRHDRSGIAHGALSMVCSAMTRDRRSTSSLQPISNHRRARRIRSIMQHRAGPRSRCVPRRFMA